MKRHSPAPRVAVIGGGVSGLACARTCAERGLAVTVFDKGRGPAGRACTRRLEGVEGVPDGLTFDHGAQYFTVRDERFARTVEEASEAGAVAPWEPRLVTVRADGAPTPGAPGRTGVAGETRRVGVPGMSALGGYLSAGLDVRWSTRVVALRSDGAGPGGWRLVLAASGGGDEVRGPFDALVVALPAPQAAELLGDVAPDLAGDCGSHRMRPCWAVMAAFEHPLPAPFDGAFVEDDVLSWVARNASKPGRLERPEGWVLHASSEWSESHLASPAEPVVDALLERFAALAGLPAVEPLLVRAHRWRWARSNVPSKAGFLEGERSDLLVCGDWLHGDRIEGAYLSGYRAARRLARSRTDGASDRR